MIKAVVFDFNGLFVLPAEEKILKELAHLTGKNFGLAQAIFLGHLKHLQEGKIDHVQFWQKIFPRLDGKTITKIAVANYKKAEENTAMYELAKKLSSKNLEVLCFSNSNNLQAKIFRSRKMYSCFDGVFLSHELGAMKPFPRAFGAFLEKTHLAANECIFVDDSLKNVIAAKMIGFNALLFKRKNGVSEAWKRISELLGGEKKAKP